MSDYIVDEHNFGDEPYDVDLGYAQDAPGYQYDAVEHQPDASSSDNDPGDVLGLLPGAPEPAILTELGSLMPGAHSEEDRESAYLGLGPAARADTGGQSGSAPAAPPATTDRVPDTQAPSSADAPSTPPSLKQGEIDSMMNSFEQSDHAGTMAILNNMSV